ncbi:Hpt domain-containing protein [Methylomonas methanica]|uniref:Hpt domain-containing protein n=1 Tax=Methylomonas methanica TaxID=421 RepID=UPI0002DE9FB7|nr:Hpt domain-containing protein [Methylomonas methanica]
MNELKKSQWVDWRAVEQHYEGRLGFILRLIDSALNGVQQANAQKLRLASRRGDFTEIGFISHTLNGFAGAFQAASVIEIAQSTENAAKDHDPDCFELSLKLADCLDALLAELQRYRESNKCDES